MDYGGLHLTSQFETALLEVAQGGKWNLTDPEVSEEEFRNNAFGVFFRDQRTKKRETLNFYPCCIYPTLNCSSGKRSQGLPETMTDAIVFFLRDFKDQKI